MNVNFFNKKAILKWIRKSLIVTTVCGIGVTYNAVFNEPIKANAFGNLDVSDTSLTGFKQISAGDGKAVFVQNDSEVIGVGENANGELGVGIDKLDEPTLLSVSNVKQVSSGRSTSMFLKNDGTVWACGLNSTGQLGVGNTKNQFSYAKVNITNVKEVDCGAEYTVYLKNDGTVWSSGNFGSKSSNVPIYSGITNIKKVIAGRYHCILVRNNNALVVVGHTSAVGLGNGITNQTEINDFKYSDLKQIVCGYDTTLYLKNDGTVWAYGDDSNMFELGSYLAKYSKSPIQIPITNVIQMAVGKQQAFFVKSDGTVWGCGLNQNGELGIGNKNEQNTLVKTPITNVKQVACGYGFTIFIKNDGTIWFSGDLYPYNTTIPILISNNRGKFVK